MWLAGPLFGHRHAVDHLSGPPVGVLVVTGVLGLKSWEWPCWAAGFRTSSRRCCDTGNRSRPWGRSVGSSNQKTTTIKGKAYRKHESKDILDGISKQLEELNTFKTAIRLPKTFYRGKGCDACGHTGYQGRIGIFEVLNVTEGIRKLIISPEFSLDNLRSAAKNEGMTTMLEDGLKKVELGMTTIEEIFRVIRE